jgi:hypothetical protein
LEPRINLIDACGDYQDRTFFSFCEKVAHRSIERTGHAYRLSVACNQREGPFYSTHRIRRAWEKQRSCFGRGHTIKLIICWVEQVNHSLYIMVQAIPRAEFPQRLWYNLTVTFWVA